MANFRKISFFQAKIGYLQLFLGKLFYFSSKVTTFEKYFLCMIRYNNILRPVHDPTGAPPAPLPKIWGSRPPTPRSDDYDAVKRDKQLCSTTRNYLLNTVH